MTDRTFPEEVLFSVADSVRDEIGVPFLRRLVDALRSAMRADIALITSGEGEPVTDVTATYALENGAPTHISYALSGTPCLRVYGGEDLIIPCALEDLYPRETGYQGYAGVPIREDDGRITGHLAVFSESEINDPEAARAILQVFGYRVEADRRHLKLRQEKQELLDQIERNYASLRAAHQDLHDANAYKTQLLGLIGHDLRNPLAAIISRTELIQTLAASSAAQTEKIGKHCDRLLAVADRMGGLISATLDRVRAESSALSPRLGETDLRDLARLAVEVNARDAEKKSTGLSLLDGPAVQARIDKDLILDAVDNLISNAIKYTPPGGDVRVGVTASDGTAIIRVEDTGQGLSEDDLARAFLPFETLSSTPTGGESSVGLGLSNVRNIARAHGGEVTATSAGKGKGAVFEIALPIAGLG